MSFCRWKKPVRDQHSRSAAESCSRIEFLNHFTTSVHLSRLPSLGCHIGGELPRPRKHWQKQTVVHNCQSSPSSYTCRFLQQDTCAPTCIRVLHPSDPKLVSIFQTAFSFKHLGRLVEIRQQSVSLLQICFCCLSQACSGFLQSSGVPGRLFGGWTRCSWNPSRTLGS